MKTVFLSYFLNESTPMYGNGNSFLRSNVRSISNGDSANGAVWTFPNHIGTHIDLPFHFIHNGKTLSDYQPSFWKSKKIQIIEIPDVVENELISNNRLQFIESIDNRTSEMIFLKTGFGRYRGEEKYWKNNPGFLPETADFIRSLFPELKMLGFDFISLSSYQNRDIGREAHREFLKSDRPILLIEDMNLTTVTPQTELNECTVAPLLVENADGTPVTILAEIQS